MDVDTALIPQDVRSLRRRWKPVKAGAAAVEQHENVRIRLHRCFSWMSRVEHIGSEGLSVDDACLIYRWIALNALYGTWNEADRVPASDIQSLRAFTAFMHEHDTDGRIDAFAREHKKLLESIVGDEHLARHFWKAPGDATHTRRAERAVYSLREALREGRTRAAIDDTLDRVYLAPGQLAHGAATFESALNRDAMRRCSRFLELLLPALCVVIIDHAWRAEWPSLCYPPLD